MTEIRGRKSEVRRRISNFELPAAAGKLLAEEESADVPLSVTGYLVSEGGVS